MSNLVQSLLESANPYNDQMGVSQKLAKKWAKSGLLEGLKDYDRTNMAVILENQAKQLVLEQSSTGGGVTNGATFTPGNGEQWAGVALPLVRKIFGQIASKEFVSVQPMSLPAGLVFFLDFQYGSSVKPFTSGDSLYGTPSANFGNEAAGGLYGAGRFGYSVNEFSASDAVVSGSEIAISTAFSDVNYTAELSASFVNSQILKVLVATSSLSGFDVNAVRSFIPTSGSFQAANLLPAFTKVNGANIEFFFTGSATGTITTGSNTFTVYYSKGPRDNSRGDFEDASGAGFPNAQSNTEIAIPEINVQMRSEAIVAKTRKLKAQWTPEFSQDLNAFHSLDAEAELTSILSEYISLEIDLEILDMLIQNVPTNQVEVWSAKVGNQLNNAKTGFDANTSGVYYTQMSWFQTLGIKLQKISNTIHQRTLRGGANWIVVSSEISAIFDDLEYFHVSNASPEQDQYNMGIERVGFVYVSKWYGT